MLLILSLLAPLFQIIGLFVSSFYFDIFISRKDLFLDICRPIQDLKSTIHLSACVDDTILSALLSVPPCLRRSSGVSHIQAEDPLASASMQRLEDPLASASMQSAIGSGPPVSTVEIVGR